MRYLVALLGIASLVFVACGSDDNGGGTPASGGSGGSGQGGTGQGGSGQGGSAGSSTSNGITPCGNFGGSAKQCIAGQYCQDETLSICANGCLSDTNCTSDQLCSKEASQNIGSCQAKPAGKDCAAFILKCKTCQPNATDAQCQQLCDAVSTACVDCVKDANCTDNTCDSVCGM